MKGKLPSARCIKTSYHAVLVVRSRNGKDWAGEVYIKAYHDIPTSQFLDLMSNAAMVALAFQDTPFAAGQIVLVIAMAMGNSVMITRTSGTIDYVEVGKTTLLVELTMCRS